MAPLPEIETPVALLAQTTLSHRDWADVAAAAQERFPELWMPGRSDLCFATTNRQTALLEIASRCDAVVVIGSANSSNTRALEKLAVEAGSPRVLRINAVDELPATCRGRWESPPGRPLPRSSSKRSSQSLAPRDGVEEVAVTDEEEYFPPPRALRDLLAAIDTVGALGLGGDPVSSPPVNDRERGASSVLAQLA